MSQRTAPRVNAQAMFPPGTVKLLRASGGRVEGRNAPAGMAGATVFVTITVRLTVIVWAGVVLVWAGVVLAAGFEGLTAGVVAAGALAAAVVCTNAAAPAATEPDCCCASCGSK
jgi:hypothetical protein